MSDDEPQQSEVFIQYKGTDICLDFWCECGAEGHFDGFFCHSIRCPRCDTVWVLPHTIALEKFDPEKHYEGEPERAKHPEMDDDESADAAGESK
jgi:hypothetical protein